MTSVLESDTTSFVQPALVSFLTRFAVALHKMRAYPPGHPMRQEAIEAAHAELRTALVGRSSLQVAVARRELVVDGRATDPAHFVLRDLAARLHRLQLGAIVFLPAAGPEELTAALQQLVVDPARTEERREPSFTSSPHIELCPMSFRALSMERGSGPHSATDDGEAAERLWRDLATLALDDGGDPDAPTGSTGGQGGAGLLVAPKSLAQALMERIRNGDAPSDEVGRTIERLGRLGGSLEGEARTAVELRLRDLLSTLPPDAVTTLLSFSLDTPAGLQQLADATDWLPTAALLELVEAAAKAQKHDLSTFLVRLLRKLASQGGAPSAPPSDELDVRGIIRQLLEGWSLDNPNPGSHSRILDLIAMHEQGSGAERATGEGIRLVQMALETGAVGDQVLEGVDLAVAGGDVPLLIQALDDEHADPVAVEAVWNRLTAGETLAAILQAANPDLTSAGRLIGRIGPDRADGLMDLALEVEDEGVRRLLVERLAGFGDVGSTVLNRRLPDVSPASQRRLLATMAGCRGLPAGLELRAFAESPEPMVRLEAVRVMLRDPVNRTEAINLGLADPDDRVVRLALDAGREELPRQSLSRLMLLLSNPRRSPDLQARAVPILAQFAEPGVKQWLYDGMAVRRGWFRRIRLAPKSPLVVAKLRLIVNKWPEAPETRRLVRLARRSGDAELIVAARPEEGA